MGLYRFTEADRMLLPILEKGRPGPPELIGGHDPTGYFAMGMKHSKSGTNILMPLNIGKMYYQYGYEQHKQLVLDALSHIYPEAFTSIQTNAHPRVEIVLQDYMMNTEGVTIDTPFRSSGHILHLVNITGFSGNTYFEAHVQKNLNFRIKIGFKPSKIWTMQGAAEIKFSYSQGEIEFTLPELTDFEGVVMER